jgi:hypothetical protein
MTSAEKRDYWRIVAECLVAFHQRKRAEATHQAKYHRSQIESLEPQNSSDIFYHREAFDVACDIAGQELDFESNFEVYDQILEGKSEQSWSERQTG